jgi:hypothetical protein
VSATNTGIGYASESTSINTDNSVSQTQADQSVTEGNRLGASLSLAQSSGNVFNLADPTATLVASGIAHDSLTRAFDGLERITDASGVATARALDLAKTVQGGQGEQIRQLVTVLIIVAGIAWAVVAVFRSAAKKKRS